MAAGKYDFDIEQGATFSRSVILRDSSGAYINLTGYTIAGKIRRKPSDTVALASFTCTITGAATGAFTFSLTATQTATLPVNNSEEPLKCLYDIESTTGSTVTRLLSGVCNITAQVTR